MTVCATCHKSEAELKLEKDTLKVVQSHPVGFTPWVYSSDG